MLIDVDARRSFFVERAKEMNAQRLHQDGWATHRCSHCTFEARIPRWSTNPKCQNCQRFDTYEQI